MSNTYSVVGDWRTVSLLRKIEPHLSFYEIEQVLQGRTFARWYCKNKKVVNALVLATPAFALTMFGVAPGMIPALLAAKVASVAGVGAGVIPAVAAAGGYSFWSGNGAILLHMLIVGFVTLVVTTFLKFTGRGDLAPLVVFVGGGVILYEVLGLFKSIYSGIAGFFQM